MPKTQIRASNILDGGVQREDLNTTTSGKALITKVIAGTGITLNSTGVDPGTGDVTINVDTSSFLTNPLDNNIFLKWRNSSNTSDLNILKVNAANQTILNGASQDLIFQISELTKWRIPNSSDSEFVFQDNIGLIRANTSDGSDTAELRINSGGGHGPSRGAFITLFANQHPTNSGRISIGAGVEGSDRQISFQTGPLVNWFIGSSGDFFPESSENIGTSSKPVGSIYTSSIFMNTNGNWIAWRNVANNANINVLRVDSNDDTILQADSGNAIGFNPNASPGFFMADVSGDMTLGNSNASSNGFIIRNNTSDGSDNKFISISSGGDISSSRGAHILCYGNEHASTGILSLNAGNVIGGEIQFFTENAKKWSIIKNGDLQPSLNNSYSIGSSSLKVKELFVVDLEGRVTWNEETGTSVTATPDKGYIANNISLVTITLPSTISVGQRIRVGGKGTGGWKIAQQAGQTIYFGSSNTTTGVGGSLSSTSRYDSVELLCITANTDFLVISSIGNLTLI